MLREVNSLLEERPVPEDQCGSYPSPLSIFLFSNKGFCCVMCAFLASKASQASPSRTICHFLVPTSLMLEILCMHGAWQSKGILQICIFDLTISQILFRYKNTLHDEIQRCLSGNTQAVSRIVKIIRSRPVSARSTGFGGSQLKQPKP